MNVCLLGCLLGQVPLEKEIPNLNEAYLVK